MSSESVTFGVDTIRQLDCGLAGEKIDAEILRAVNDIDQRGQDGKVRVVKIEFQFARKDDTVWIGYKAEAKLPPQVGAPTVGKIRVSTKGNSKVIFQPFLFEEAGDEKP
jgi:hypothetical protein